MTSPFEPFPVLETERLVLRAIGEDDAPEILRHFTDPDVLDFFMAEPHQSLDESRAWARDLEERRARGEGIRWGITRKGDDRLIGNAGYWRWVNRHYRAELGYLLDSRAWGQGIMTEAIGALVRFGFARMELHSVEANIDPSNRRSRRVLEKLGFVQEGLIRENYFFRGKFYDSVLLSLLAPQ